jgi:hypothetical protein
VTAKAEGKVAGSIAAVIVTAIHNRGPRVAAIFFPVILAVSGAARRAGSTTIRHERDFGLAPSRNDDPTENTKSCFPA